jgi:outer membrane protein TolC
VTFRAAIPAIVVLAAATVHAQPATETAPVSVEPPPEVSAAAAQVALESTSEPDTSVRDSSTAGSGAGQESPPGLLLPELLSLAANHPLVGAAEADLDAAEARLAQSYWAQFSNWSFNTMFTFVPPAGDWEYEQWRAAHSGDVQWNSSILDWGPWIRLSISGAVPIYTFGKFSGAQDAAQAGVDASTVGIERAQQEVQWQMRRAYLTLLLARDILYLIDDGRGYIDDAREEVQKRIDAGEGGGATVDLYKIDAMSADVDARELQASRLERISLSGVRLLAGIDDSQEVADIPLVPFAIETRPLADYLDLAQRERSDMRMLDAAVAAQEAKVSIERARYFPDFAVTASAGYSYSNVTADQHSPWINDPFNSSWIGAALVLDYPLDFGMDYHRVDEAQAVLRRLEEQRDALAQVAQTEVTDAYESVVEAAGRMEAWDRGRRAAKRWLISVLQSMTLGLSEASDLTDGLLAYFQNELNYLNAVYDLDVAWARLTLATGSPLLDDVSFAESP